jgi:hypothetical protein
VAVVPVDHCQAGAHEAGGRRWRCRHGARRWRRCGGDRRPCAEVRCRRQVARASAHGSPSTPPA